MTNLPQPSTRTVLVLGATGGIGGETANALERHGWTIRALSRRGRPDGDTSGWDWVKGDSMNRAAIVAAAEGVQAIVHAVNPPGYKNWSELVLPMLDNTVAAAQASGARILLPGTVYNYGPDAFPILKEDSPQNATTHKGKIRIELEKRLEDAAEEGVKTLIVRFGDFFGPNPGSSWFSQGMVKPGGPLKSISYPGKKGVGHAWTYLPDGAETFAQLMNREGELETFARFHFGGHYDPDGMRMIKSIREVVGKPSLPVRPIPWFIFRIGGLFNETMRELYRVRPLWETTVKLDNSRLAAFLGDVPHTAWNTAVTETLVGLGCLPPEAADKTSPAPSSSRQKEGVR